MGAIAESLPARVPGLRSSALKRPLSLQQGGCRLTVEPDGAVRSLYSLQERRSLFGFEQVSIYKVQAGIVVHAQKPDWALRITPRSVQLSGRVFESVEVAQSLEFNWGESPGYSRRLRLRNGAQPPIRLRLLELLDPTAAHFGSPGEWGSLGLNAFNRESHVAMDEVSDPPSARVVGAAPAPSKFYMTTSAPRAQEVLSLGELPEATAGMSGQVLAIASHEVELAPGESREIVYATVYAPGKLEDALSEFGRIQSGERRVPRVLPTVACSERGVTEAASWAATAVEGGAYGDVPLDGYEVLPALARMNPSLAYRFVADAKRSVQREGWLPHSSSQSSPGVLETSLFLRGVAELVLASQDKKQARSHYPTVKKLAAYLMSSSKELAVVTDPSLPQGWRRHLGSGYPSGEVPEVSLALAGALFAASQLARMLSKSDEASRFRERSEMVLDHVRKKLIGERGLLSLCRDSSGRLRDDDTIDMAVAAYRHQFMSSAEQAVAHRLLEKDFDTPYGPRCVPTTNQVCFNGAYGRGQLGGVWTRAVLAHAVACYRAGLPGIGGLALGKVARLVTDEAVRVGGSPGEFPLWLDSDARVAHGNETDPVSAARFLEALLEGELGLAVGADGVSFSPPDSSTLGWVLASDLGVGGFSAFVGRGGGKSHLFIGGGRAAKSAGRFAKSERLDLPAKGAFGVTMHSPGQVVCLGNSTASPVRVTVSFPPRAAELSKRLSTPLEEYDQSKSSWNKVGSLRVSASMVFDAALDPNGWKVFRISTP